jgi:polyisoprenoid-binding protein YceI
MSVVSKQIDTGCLETLRSSTMLFRIVCALLFAVVPAASYAQVPEYEITPQQSMIKFHVKSSVDLAGQFEQWDATLKFSSVHAESGVLDIRIRAASVQTGSHFKNDKLKSKDFFNVAHDPWITFKSTKVVQTSQTTFDVSGIFTIRGVSRPETLKLTVDRTGVGSGRIQGTMAFDRKDYGMDSNIPFIRIANRVEVDVDLTAKRTSGPAVVFKY